ncbi:MBOAT family protein [candidate division KSB1 bacterium]|nr:MBOAT family protein [candidate division KSB1 bacterium]
MLFNSLHFLVFFPIVVAIYFSLKARYRWVFLLLSSYYFYMCWNPKYIVLILFSTMIDYIAGLQMEKQTKPRIRQFFLIASLCSNLGLLFLFKYYTFFSQSVLTMFNQFNIFVDFPAFDFLLPVGISFYTFQTLSYTIDVYRGKKKAERHLGIFALYVAFFPQLVAGPIERSTRLLPQLFEKKRFDYQRVSDGLKLMLWGFFKKVVIADRLAVMVDSVYNSAHDYTGIPLIVATYFFAFQIYCDFSGYSDIAIGAAQVMGYDLMDNFKRPYFSKNISEFWKRWHISLSSWFKDYLYISLGGNRVAKWRWYSNLMIVFLISGLWHGADWTFVIWGGLHGMYLTLSIWTGKFRIKFIRSTHLDKHPAWLKLIQVVTTFHLVLFGWIFFRANNLFDALYIIKNIFADLSWHQYTVGLNQTEFVIAVLSILFMECIHMMQRHRRMRQFLNNKPKTLRWSVYLILLLSIIMFGVFTKQEFIYFQF